MRSHGGEPEHVALIESMLEDIGLEEGDLACGPQDPLSPRGAKILRESGARTRRTHNNCSGKHTAMLAYAQLKRLANRRLRKNRASRPAVDTQPCGALGGHAAVAARSGC